MNCLNHFPLLKRTKKVETGNVVRDAAAIGLSFVKVVVGQISHAQQDLVPPPPHPPTHIPPTHTLHTHPPPHTYTNTHTPTHYTHTHTLIQTHTHTHTHRERERELYQLNKVLVNFNQFHF